MGMVLFLLRSICVEQIIDEFLKIVEGSNGPFERKEMQPTRMIEIQISDCKMQINSAQFLGEENLKDNVPEESRIQMVSQTEISDSTLSTYDRGTTAVCLLVGYQKQGQMVCGYKKVRGYWSQIWVSMDPAQTSRIVNHYTQTSQSLHEICLSPNVHNHLLCIGS